MPTPSVMGRRVARSELRERLIVDRRWISLRAKTIDKGDQYFSDVVLKTFSARTSRSETIVPLGRLEQADSSNQGRIKMEMSMKQLMVFPLEEGFGFNENSLETNIIILSVIITIVVSFGGNVLLENRRESIVMTLQQADQRAKEAEQKLVDAKNRLRLAKRRGEEIRHQGKESEEREWLDSLAQTEKDLLFLEKGTEEVIPQLCLVIFQLWLYWRLWSLVFWSFFRHQSILLKKERRRFQPYAELSPLSFYFYLLNLLFSPLNQVIRQLWLYWRLWLLDFCIYFDLLSVLLLKTFIFLFWSFIQLFRSVIQLFKLVIQFWSNWKYWLLYFPFYFKFPVAPRLKEIIRRLWDYPRIPLLILCLSTIPLTSFYFPSWQFISFLASYRVPFHSCLYFSTAFCIALIFFYITDIPTRHYYSEIFSAFLLFLLIQYLFPYWYTDFLYFWVVSLSALVKSLIIKRVVILLLVLFILQPQLLLDRISLHLRLQIIPLHLIATELLLISILSFQSFRVLFSSNFFGPLNGVLLAAFVYYLPIPNMPYFFLSFPSIIQRTIASFLLLFLISSPQLLTFVGAATATVLVVLLTPQTVQGNYVVRRLHETEYADYAEAKRFIRRLSWSVITLFWIFMVTNWVIHYPEHLKFLTYPAR